MTLFSRTSLNFILLLYISKNVTAQKPAADKPDFSLPKQIPGMALIWNDEFIYTDKPNAANWIYENGFVRNKELQWYQPGNANCKNGVLLIEGRKQQIKNPNFTNTSDQDWTRNRPYAEYSSASIKTQGLHEFTFGRFLIRARIDTASGSWPAIWSLGAGKIPWPSCGEIDIMEFYRINHVPTILANVATGNAEAYKAKWFSEKIPLQNFIANDKDWAKKFHVWRMDWDKDGIQLFIDDVLVNKVVATETFNSDGSNPFLQPQYLLLNLALGENGGDPANSKFPIKYEVDYVRVYQKK